MKNEPKGESQMKSQLFEQDKMEKEGVAGSFLLQNRHTLKVELNGEVYAKQGAINTSNLLAFESTLQWDIKMVKPGMQMLAAGLSNVTVSGTGLVAISSFGTPFVLQVNEPTYVDVQAALAWSSSLQTDIKIHLQGWFADRPGQRRELPNAFYRRRICRSSTERGT
jgi:uncharacterized protein (AIM24 family)